MPEKFLEILDRLQSKHGWTDDLVLTLLQDYLATFHDDPFVQDLITHLKRVSADLNELGVAVVIP